MKRVYLLATVLMVVVCACAGPPTPSPEEKETAIAHDVDPRLFVLGLDDLPSGFYLEEEREDYAEPTYEPKNINPESLEGLRDGYGVIFLSGASIENLFGTLLIGQINFVYESVPATQKGFAERIWWPPDVEKKQISGPQLGDESFSCIAQVESEDFEGTAYAVAFRKANIVITVYTAALSGGGSVDTVVELATIAEEKLAKLL